ncbi:hypothetical protein D3C73_1580900 [compost metagenome]
MSNQIHREVKWCNSPYYSDRFFERVGHTALAARCGIQRNGFPVNPFGFFSCEFVGLHRPVNLRQRSFPWF